jgi:hypothetical protein
MDNKQCETYFDIAKREGLTGKTAERYVLYMTKRWGDKKDERIKCLVGYASEWAERFAQGQEYNCSDCRENFYNGNNPLNIKECWIPVSMMMTRVILWK